jgi:hypothetical protein
MKALGQFSVVSVLAAESDKPKVDKLPSGDRQPVLMLGDSMMRLLSKAMEKELKKEGYEAKSFTSLGSGLARLDAFDWYTKIDGMMKEVKPATVVVTLGANDRQPLRDDNGNTLQFGTAEWRVEYTQRIGRAMDAIVSNGAKHVIWLLLPDMKEHTHQMYGDLVNEIYKEQAAMDSRKDIVALYDMRPLISRKPGTYTHFIMSNQGEALTVRDPDGVHLTSMGAKIVAEGLVKTFWKDE